MSTSPFNLTGSSRRRELWLALAIFLLVLTAVLWLSEEPKLWAYARFAQAALPIACAALLMSCLRRLHALRRPGLWALLLFVPFVCLGLLGWLLTKRGRVSYRSHDGVISVAALSACLCAYGVWRLFYMPLLVVSGAMTPTLLAGDYVAARYSTRDAIERGDILVVRLASGQMQTTRVVGLPGDSLQMKEGTLWLNGVQIPQKPNGVYSEIMGPQGPLGQRPRCGGGPVGDGGLCQKTIWTESLPEGRSYDVLNIESEAHADNTARVTVGQGQFFGLGDNRDDSADSRFSVSVGGLGMISADQVVAHGRRVLFSAAGTSPWQVWTWRLNRFFEAVE